MNWDRIEGNWKTFKGQVKQKWAKLTDSDLDLVSGKKDELVGRLQNAYGIQKDEAERQIDDFTRSINDEPRRDPAYTSKRP